MIPDLPGWDSLPAVTRYHGWAEIIGIAVLALLVVAEVVSYKYGKRKDDLTDQQQTATNRRHDEEMARVQHDTAQANERAANLEREASALRLQLDREIQKRAQRILTDKQKAAMLSELKGKISEIAIVVQNDLEAQAFSIQFFSVFGEAGTTATYVPEPPPADRWWAPGGLLMYSPSGANEDQLNDDPLYLALKRANLFGGTTSRPFLSGQLRGPIPAVIPGYNGHVLYIGQKSPF